MDNGFQARALTTQRLCSLLIVPDTGFGEFQLYLGEAFLAISEVKDTP